MALIVDATAIIARERRGYGPDAIDAVAPGERLVLAAVTASELLIGVHRADPARRRQRSPFVEGMIARLPLIPFDLLAARAHARLWSDLAAAGTPIGPNDLLIAATALAHGHDVLTGNAREFRRVPV